jgi:hypothetical protein
VVKGWAANLQSGRPAEDVLLFVGDELVAAARPSVERPEVALHFNQPGIARSGYSITIPLIALRGDETLRVFAVSEGMAGELHQNERPPMEAIKALSQGNPVESDPTQ